MADADFPIDINYAKIADWLVDRKLLQRDWRPRLAAIQEQALRAAQDLAPEHARLLRAPWEEQEEEDGKKGSDDRGGKAVEEESTTFPSVDHPAAVRVRAALVSDPETAKKSLLGTWQGQAGTWDKLCRAYARGGGGSAAGSLPVAEAALALSRLVEFRIPALRASTSRGHQTLRDLDRRAADCLRQAAQAARDFEAECSALGVSPLGGAAAVDGELRALVSRELRPLLRSAAEALRSEEVGRAVGYYAAFVRYAHGGGGKEEGGGGGSGGNEAGEEGEGEEEEPLLLPALAAVRAAPSADLGGGLSPSAASAAAAASTSASDSDAAAATTATATEISWEIDVSSSGAEAESGGGGGEEEAAGSSGGGGIAWDIEVPAAADAPSSSISADTLAAAASSVEREKKEPLDILSGLASADPSARARLGDDLAELSAFLGQRLAASRLGGGGGVTGGAPTAADLPPDAPAELSSLPACEALRPALAALCAAEEALSGERAATLLLLGQPGGKGAERIAARLRQRAAAEGKFRRAAAAASARAAVVRSELASDARELRRAAAAARDAKKRAEEGVASILGGDRPRKVAVVGEVSAVLAAAERG